MVDFVDRRHHAREDRLIELIGKRDPAAAADLQTDEDHVPLTGKVRNSRPSLQSAEDPAWVATGAGRPPASLCGNPGSAF